MTGNHDKETHNHIIYFSNEKVYITEYYMLFISDSGKSIAKNDSGFIHTGQ